MKRIGFIVIILLSIGTSCKKENTENCHYYMTIKNNNEFTIYAHGTYIYPDSTGFTDRFPSPLLNPHIFKINPHSRNTTAIRNDYNCLEYSINSDVLCPSHVFMIYLFREDSLQQNPWEEAPEFVLKRYDLTISELDAMNWTISYP